MGNSFFAADVSYVMKHGGWVFIAQIVTSFSAFVLSVIFSYFLPKEEFGVYKYILSMAGILGGFSLTGLHTGIIRSTAKGKEGLFKDSFLLSMKWGLVSTCLSLFVSGYYFLNQNNILALSFIIIAICQPLLNSALLFRSFLNGKQSYRSLSSSNIIISIVSSFIIGLTVLFTKNPILIILSYFLSNLILAILIFSYVQKKFIPNSEHEENEISYSKHSSLINILDIVANNIDKVILFQMLGGTSVSIYTFALAFPEQIRNVYKIIPMIATPKFAKRPLEEIKKVFLKRTLRMFVASSILILLYIWTAPKLYTIFFPQYTDSVMYSIVFSITLLIEGGLSNAIFKAKQAIKEQYKVSIGSNILKITLLIICAFFWGLWGVIIARVISRFLGFLLSLFLTIQLIHDPEKKNAF